MASKKIHMNIIACHEINPQLLRPFNILSTVTKAQYTPINRLIKYVNVNAEGFTPTRPIVTNISTQGVFTTPKMNNSRSERKLTTNIKIRMTKSKVSRNNTYRFDFDLNFCRRFQRYILSVPIIYIWVYLLIFKEVEARETDKFLCASGKRLRSSFNGLALKSQRKYSPFS